MAKFEWSCGANQMRHTTHESAGHSGLRVLFLDIIYMAIQIEDCLPCMHACEARVLVCECMDLETYTPQSGVSFLPLLLMINKIFVNTFLNSERIYARVQRRTIFYLLITLFWLLFWMGHMMLLLPFIFLNQWLARKELEAGNNAFCSSSNWAILFFSYQ